MVWYQSPYHAAEYMTVNYSTSMWNRRTTWYSGGRFWQRGVVDVHSASSIQSIFNLYEPSTNGTKSVRTLRVLFKTSDFACRDCERKKKIQSSRAYHNRIATLCFSKTLSWSQKLQKFKFIKLKARSGKEMGFLDPSYARGKQEGEQTCYLL